MTKVTATDIARDLLSIKAVSLSPQHYYTWTSGIRSPIYCDNRLTMSYPQVRQRLAQGLVDLIEQHYGQVEVIAGTATAGIPHAAWVSDRLNLPMIYVRDAKKKHGKTNQIEGRITPGARVVIVEDLISTGLSSLKVAQALTAAGYQVLGVVAIFSYRLPKAEAAFQVAGLSYDCLTDYPRLIQEALVLGEIEEEDLATLIEWQAQLT